MSTATAATAAAKNLDAAEDAPTFDFSVRQLLASAAAAVTAALLGSRLGVAGTLIGAGLASAVSMIASAIYSHSLASAQYRVRQARAQELGLQPDPTVAAAMSDVAPTEVDFGAPTQPIPSHQQAWGLAPVTTTASANPWPTVVAPIVTAPARRRPRWVVATVGTVAAAAIALLVVTGIEAVRGTPLSGGNDGGLSVSAADPLVGPT